MANTSLASTKQKREAILPGARRSIPRGYLRLRLIQVARALIAQRSVAVVERSIMEEWGITLRRARQYVRMVYDLWARAYEEDILQQSARALADREEVVRRALETGQLRVALAAMDSRDRILGVLREHINVSGNIRHTHRHKADLAALVEAARRNGHGAEEAAAQRRAFLGRGGADSN